MQILNTLYVTTPESYVRPENDTIRVDVERETQVVLMQPSPLAREGRGLKLTCHLAPRRDSPSLRPQSAIAIMKRLR